MNALELNGHRATPRGVHDAASFPLVSRPFPRLQKPAITGPRSSFRTASDPSDTSNARCHHRGGATSPLNGSGGSRFEAQVLSGLR